MGLISALQWSDTAFPSGMYTLSHGLEGLADAAWLDRESLLPTITALVESAAATSDARAASLAWRWAEESAELGEIHTIDEVLFASKPNEFARRGSQRVGRQLASMAVEVLDPEADSPLGRICSAVSSKDMPGNQAVVAAVIHHHEGVSLVDTISCELYSLVAGACSAAVRLRLADHISSQQILHQLTPRLEEMAADCVECSCEVIGALSPALDIASAWHETAPARLFLN